MTQKKFQYCIPQEIFCDAHLSQSRCNTPINAHLRLPHYLEYEYVPQFLVLRKEGQQ